MKRIFSSFLLFGILSVLFLSVPSAANAATFRNGETVSINSSLTDLYVSGGTVTITAPTRNDLTVAGGTVNLLSPVQNGLLAAGGTLNIKGEIGNTLRAAGGTITISSPVKRDAVLFGGTILLDETASVSGDLIVSGGTINVQAPITGNIYVNGGQVTINAPVGGNIEGEVGTLILGNNAVINGNLTYASEERATLRDGAVLRGQEQFTQVQREEQHREKIAGVVTTFSFYMLITDILASLALIYMFYAFTRRVTEQSSGDPLKNGLLGLATLIIGPIIAFCLLVILLPGVVALVLYALLLLLAIFLGKLFAGWVILRWWFRRKNEAYELDWKAAVLGPIVLFMLMLIPVIGWFIGFLIYLVALGGLTSVLIASVSGPKARIARAKTSEAISVRRTRPTRKKR